MIIASLRSPFQFENLMFKLIFYSFLEGKNKCFIKYNYNYNSIKKDHQIRKECSIGINASAGSPLCPDLLTYLLEK